MLRRLLLAIFAQLYITGVKFRHFLYNAEFIRGEGFDVPIICVGNITVGGSGKTPMCELLIEHFAPQFEVAILSRGYGRRTRGYREVLATDDYHKTGDEPLQMKQKYPEVLVVVCKNRVEAVKRIAREHPEVNLIIMDDGFQHRKILPKINVIMLDFTRPFYTDSPLPLGTLRDTPDELHRADYFIVTKCPAKMSDLDISFVTREIEATPHQRTYLTTIENLPPTPISGGEPIEFEPIQEVIAMAAIGNPVPFVEMVEKRYTLVEKLLYSDHHNYNRGDLNEIKKVLKQHPKAVILTTEKDWVKLLKNNKLTDEIAERIFFTPMKMKFLTGSSSDLLLNIEKDVRKN
ncbi:MAG: tetraacyldisaccharide 4'-kinase [Rikenellaceae bacterium]